MMNKNAVKAVQRRLDAGLRSFDIGETHYHLGDVLIGDSLQAGGYYVLFAESKYVTIHYRVINGKLEE